MIPSPYSNHPNFPNGNPLHPVYLFNNHAPNLIPRHIVSPITEPTYPKHITSFHNHNHHVLI